LRINRRERLNKNGYRYHQAADLPTLFDIIRHQLEEPDGSLIKMMTENEVKLFRKLMRKAKDIRNKMAHHNALNEDQLNDLENVKQILSDMLEFAIRSVASDRGIYQVCFELETGSGNILTSIQGRLVSVSPYL
jgi:hypothetical protein